jgi:hypothetical protein
MNEAYDYAVTNVVVLPTTRYDFKYSSYNYDYKNVDDQLLHTLKYNNGNQFVKFYSPAEARNSNVRVDRVVELQFQNVIIGGFNDSRKTREVSKQVVTKEIVYKPDSVVKVYGTVKAKITTTQRTRHSEGSLQITVRDENGHIIWTDILKSNDDWYTDFTTYTGDERALSDSDRDEVNRKQEFPPSEEEIINCLTGDINNNLPYKIKDYFNRM